MSERSRTPRRMADRGQLSLPLIEAALGVLVILAIAGGFALGVPHPNGSERQLDVYASDVATVLAAEAAAGNATVTVLGDGEAERRAFRAHLDAVLPANYMYRATTPWGTIGYPRPPGVAVGRATVPSVVGPITVEVWDA
ncbi:DUF7262 family protein [Halarchaeum salinum]